MAKMFPNNIDSYNPVYSERIVYNELQRQLPDEVSVFYSVSWVYKKNDYRENSEADFVVFDPAYGFLSVEVKGGNGLKIDDNIWYLQDSSGERKLKRSPYEQAEASMRYFLDYYGEVYNSSFKGVYGSLVIFPMFEIPDSNYIGNRPLELTVSASELEHLYDKIRQAFIFWRSKGNSSAGFTEEQKTRFKELMQRRLAIAASSGALIEQNRSLLNAINRIQDNFIQFLSNYRQFSIQGGAGTGKTWIGMKFANILSKQNLEVLFLCYNAKLAKYIKGIIDNHDIEVKDIKTLLVDSGISAEKYDKSLIGVSDDLGLIISRRYDAIIVDEAQDFSEELAMVSRLYLKDDKESRFIVLFDTTQNIYGRDFGEQFLVTSKPYVLRENLRNTASIYNWATARSDLGKDVVANPVIGPEPAKKTFRDLESLYRQLEYLLNDLVVKEKVRSESITLIIDDDSFNEIPLVQIAAWHFVDTPKNITDIQVTKTSDFKGQEADVVIYLHLVGSNKVFDYVAYTRARFYLFDYSILFKNS